MPYLQSSPKPKAWNAGSNLKPKNIWKGEPYQTIVKISRKFPPLLSTFSLSLLLWSCEKGARASLDKLGRRLTLDNAPLLRSEPPLFSFYPLFLIYGSKYIQQGASPIDMRWPVHCRWSLSKLLGSSDTAGRSVGAEIS